MNIVKTIKLLDKSGILINGITETVKREIKKEDGFYRSLITPSAASLLQPVIPSVVKGISGRRVRRAAGGYMNKDF